MAKVTKKVGCRYKDNTPINTVDATAHPSNHIHPNWTGRVVLSADGFCGSSVMIYAVVILGWRSMAFSFTGKFTNAANNPSAMDMYQTMS